MSKKILIIDDDDDHLVLTRKILTQIGHFSVVVCNNSLLAVETIQKEKPDLVLLDIMMPRLDGFSVLKQIRETEEIKRVKIIMYSAKIFDVDKKKAIQLGANAYISKIIESHKLIDTVNDLLQTA
jgi:PleD family two-component response regulator